MGRNILFITTDQQRYDSLGCNGGQIARTPVVDGLAASGINYRRAYCQNTVCMPARSTMLTGQYARTHGVVANGIPLPTDGSRRRAGIAAVKPVNGAGSRRRSRQCTRARRSANRRPTTGCGSRPNIPSGPRASPRSSAPLLEVTPADPS